MWSIFNTEKSFLMILWKIEQLHLLLRRVRTHRNRSVCKGAGCRDGAKHSSWRWKMTCRPLKSEMSYRPLWVKSHLSKWIVGKLLPAHSLDIICICYLLKVFWNLTTRGAGPAEANAQKMIIFWWFLTFFDIFPEDIFFRIFRGSSKIVDFEYFYYVFIFLRGPSGIHQNRTSFTIKQSGGL